MKKAFVVFLSTGGYDDFGSKDLFICEKEYQAKFYCSRANAVLKRYKKYYQNILNNYHKTNIELTDYSHYSDRAQFVSGWFGYHEINFRNIKVR